MAEREEAWERFVANDAGYPTAYEKRAFDAGWDARAVTPRDDKLEAFMRQRGYHAPDECYLTQFIHETGLPKGSVCRHCCPELARAAVSEGEGKE